MYSFLLRFEGISRGLMSCLLAVFVRGCRPFQEENMESAYLGLLSDGIAGLIQDVI